MVANALKGKPIQASQKDIHDGRSLGLRGFERRWKQLRDGADVGGVGISVTSQRFLCAKAALLCLCGITTALSFMLSLLSHSNTKMGRAGR